MRTQSRRHAFKSVGPFLVLAHTIDLGDPEVTADVAVLRGLDDKTECLLQQRQLEPSWQSNDDYAGVVLRWIPERVGEILIERDEAAIFGRTDPRDVLVWRRRQLLFE